MAAKSPKVKSKKDTPGGVLPFDVITSKFKVRFFGRVDVELLSMVILIKKHGNPLEDFWP